MIYDVEYQDHDLECKMKTAISAKSETEAEKVFYETFDNCDLLKIKGDLNMNKYPERKYNSINEVIIDADLPKNIRESCSLVYESMIENKEKWAMYNVNNMINYYVNKAKK